MVKEAVLFDKSERYFIDRLIIDEIALPLNDIYGDEVYTEYNSDYMGLARKYRPKRIFEIGVRYGYTAICMMLAMHKLRGAPKPEFVGIDDESYHAGSCARANEHFERLVPWANARCIKCRSFDGLPADIGTFDMIHIDGHHEAHAILNDAPKAWPLLNPGGIMIFDDAMEGCSVFQGIQQFLDGFRDGPEVVEYQYYPDNLRHHVYLRKDA